MLRRIRFLSAGGVLDRSRARRHNRPPARSRGVLTDDSGAVIPAAPVALDRRQWRAENRPDPSRRQLHFRGPGPRPYTVKAVAFPGFATFYKAVTVNRRQQRPAAHPAVDHGREAGESRSPPKPARRVSVEPDNNATALVIKGEDLAGPARRSRRSGRRPAGAGRPRRRTQRRRRSISTDSPAASFLPRNPSARSASTRIPSRRNSTGWASAASKSSPSRAPTSSAAAVIFNDSNGASSIRAIPSPATSRTFPTACSAATSAAHQQARPVLLRFQPARSSTTTPSPRRLRRSHHLDANATSTRPW